MSRRPALSPDWAWKGNLRTFLPEVIFELGLTGGGSLTGWKVEEGEKGSISGRRCMQVSLEKPFQQVFADMRVPILEISS